MPVPQNDRIAELRLKKNEDRRLLAGHLWVFSNEVDTAATPLKSFEPGEPVAIISASGRRIGFGYVNPKSLIAARLCSLERLPDHRWLQERLQDALSLRDALYGDPYYRLVHGEGDFLPGLVIDRYGDILVVQITTAGMDRLKDSIVDLLTELFSPRSIILRNDSKLRELEGLPLCIETAGGELPELLQVSENGFHYEITNEAAQKTGWFYDHRDNRHRVAQLANGRRVLDCYCYAGAWGINALGAGADSVMAIDGSASAIESAQHNAKLNGCSERLTTVVGDVVETLRSLRDQKQTFDLIILDPPAFIKRKKDYKAGLNYYALNNRLAMQLLSAGGILASASCSQPLDRASLSNTMLRASRKLHRDLRLIGELGQGADHPINPAMVETHYLKGSIGRV